MKHTELNDEELLNRLHTGQRAGDLADQAQAALNADNYSEHTRLRQEVGKEVRAAIRISEKAQCRAKKRR